LNSFKGIHIITIKDKSYPNKLRNIYNLPICLFYKGNINLANKKIIAVVGCRDCSNYGARIAFELSYKLSKKGIIIISGGARGIDTCAHKGALAANMPTIEVLGNSLEYIYPPENKELEEKILKAKGLIISEYINGTKPSKITFPERNRIISGLSDGVIVVEAKKESGSIITVDYALEQGKNVYAVPGNITSKYSEGTNELIKQGAKAVTKIEDILEEL